jgi:hypothetical protein
MDYLYIPTKNEISSWLGSKSPYYKECVEKSVEIATVIESKYGRDLLNSRNPSEPDFIKEYRIKEYRVITNTYFEKILNSLSAIATSEDFKVFYPEMPPIIDELENLQSYLTINFPYEDNIVKWLNEKLLRALLTEPNGVCLVKPINFDIQQGQYYEPYCYLYPAEDVLHYEKEHYCVLADGDKRIVVTNAIYYEYEYNHRKQEYVLVRGVEHNIGYMPAFKLGGTLKDKRNKAIYSSFISGVVDFWKEALVNQSNLQGMINQHVYPEKEEILDTSCNVCGGTGKIRDAEGINHVCGTCNGTGHVINRGVFGTKIIRPADVGEVNPQFPTIHYVEKNIEPVKFVEEYVDKCIYRGLAAINFEFLFETPLNQSGVAKEYDRAELNKFIRNIAKYLSDHILRNSIYFISAWRYGATLSFEELDTIQPTIVTPQTFDIATGSIIYNDYINAKNAGFHNAVLIELQQRYIDYKFADDKKTRDIIKMSLELDPYVGVSSEEAKWLIESGGMTPMDLLVSRNIQYILRELVNEIPNFIDLSYERKRQLVIEKVKTINSNITHMSNDIQQTTTLNDNNIV